MCVLGRPARCLTAIRRQGPGQAKVTELHHAFSRQQYVGGLDVTVHHSYGHRTMLWRIHLKSHMRDVRDQSASRLWSHKEIFTRTAPLSEIPRTLTMLMVLLLVQLLLELLVLLLTCWC